MFADLSIMSMTLSLLAGLMIISLLCLNDLIDYLLFILCKVFSSWLTGCNAM